MHLLINIRTLIASLVDTAVIVEYTMDPEDVRFDDALPPDPYFIMNFF